MFLDIMLGISALIGAFSLFMIGCGIVHWSKTMEEFVTDYRAIMRTMISHFEAAAAQAGIKPPTPDHLPDWLK